MIPSRGSTWARPLRAVAIVLLGLALPAPAFGQEEVEAAIRNLIQQLETGHAAGDAEAVAAIYAPDATHTFATGETVRGRAEIADALAGYFAGPLHETEYAAEILRVWSLSPEIALEQEAFTITGIKGPDGEEMPPLEGRCLVVYHKTGGEWLVEAAQCMVPFQPPVPE